MKTLGRNKLTKVLLGATALALFAGEASAGGYIQTLGLSQRSSSLAGAVTAKSQEFDAWYTNPAGAADFVTPVIGLTAKIIDTTNLTIEDGSGNSGIRDTLTGEQAAIAPATGVYLPMIPGSVVAGLGIGAPFAIGHVDNDQPYGSIASNEDVKNIELLYIEAAPTIAVKLTDRINIGGTVNFGLAKHLKAAAQFDDLAGLSNVVGTTDGQGISGIIVAQTDDDLPLPVAPWEFATDPTAVTFTLGTQIQLTDTLRFGATYREETPNQFEGTLDFAIQTSPQVGAFLGTGPFSACTGDSNTAGVACSTSGPGGTNAYFGEERFKVDLELPRHIQFGFAWQALPRWELSFDAQWTNWSDATGFGSPAIFNFVTTQSVNNTGNFNTAIGGMTNLLCALTGVPGGGLNPNQPPALCPQGIDQIAINYQAQDAWSFMVGSEYQLNDRWTFLSGYQYDEAFMPNSSLDLITYDTDKHYFTGGVEYSMPSPFGLMKLNLGGQIIWYEEQTIEANQSTTLGGLGPNATLGGVCHQAPGQPNPGNNAIFGCNQAGFGINEEAVTIGDGYIWTVGASATLHFGATEAAPIK